jgi:ABC-type dipeptide/oligopeptide/nickel transport system permease subunit
VVRSLRLQIATPAGGAFAAAVLLLVMAACFPRWLSRYNPLQIQGAVSLQPPTWNHVLGTDLLGKDVLSQIIYGTRTTLLVGVSAILLSLVTGTTIGLASGFWGGSVLDECLMRLIDALYVFPDLILALTLVAILGPEHIWSVVIALAAGPIPAYARLVRGRVLSLREAEFVAAARSIGASVNRVLIRHILPQTSDVIVVRSVIGLSGVILGEAALSFLGLGVQPPTPSWGRMLRDGFQFLGTAPWVALPPGFAIFLTVFIFNQAGEMIRDLLDPHAMTARVSRRSAARTRNLVPQRAAGAPSVSTSRARGEGAPAPETREGGSVHRAG